MTTGLQFGAPGMYPALRPRDDAGRPEPVRLDITGFVGIAVRGPIHQPVRVRSWSDFVHWFGAMPGSEPNKPKSLLPRAVNAYFLQGGTEAWVVRVLPDGSTSAVFESTNAPAGTTLRIAAANAGSWADELKVSLEFDAAAEAVADVANSKEDQQPTTLIFRGTTDIPTDSLLRIRHPFLPGAGLLTWVDRIEFEPVGGRLRQLIILDRNLGIPVGHTIVASVITGALTVTEAAGDSRATGLGLRPAHPNYIGRYDSDDFPVRPHAWEVEVLPEDGLLRPIHFTRTGEGHDRLEDIDFQSFFDAAEPNEQDPSDDDNDHRGVDRIARIDEIGLLCVPDLLWRWRREPDKTIVRSRPRDGAFHLCQVEPDVEMKSPTAPATLLDVTDIGEFAEINRRQQRLVAVARQKSRFVALIDVPQGLSTQDIGRWRSQFDCDFAACYHPWLAVSGPGTPAEFLPPSAFAAGITAAREVRFGVHWGPANELARGVVVASSLLGGTEAGALHRLSINVFRPERDGFRLAAAHTMSADPQYRQLSVRRLMTFIKLTLKRLGDQLVFEPGTLELQIALRQQLTTFLGELFRRGALAGATEAESYFVSCDERLNDDRTRARGQLIAEVGVAPAGPLEFLVLRLAQNVDGTTVQERS